MNAMSARDSCPIPRTRIPGPRRPGSRMKRVHMSRTCGVGVELLQSRRKLTTKVGEQPWPQLVHCALICCRVCGCIFQEDGICCQEFWRGIV